MVLGRVSTSTIAGGIADYKAFKNHPYVFAYGMVSSQPASQASNIHSPWRPRPRCVAGAT